MTSSRSNLLYDILFEHKDKSPSLIKMIELGFIPDSKTGNPCMIEDMTYWDFIDNLAAVHSNDLRRTSGAFSTALIDFGSNPAECVIKISDADSADQAAKYLRYCKGKSGRDYCVAFPDVYYLGTVDIHAGNLGWRADGSVFVFDPLSYNE